ncbi:hypothetical protein R83H12_00090 [Fibrobacteria bacterium R8-3-H12]
MFNRVNFEISGICNAKCKYCQTGRANIERLTRQKSFVEAFVNLDEFKKSIEYMLSNDIINSNTNICLYNWGEPFLHPKFKEIICYLSSLNLNFSLSTNASKPIYFENSNALKNLKHITFSMPGFSQESYDRIHGFNFIKIKKNIVSIIENYRQFGFMGAAIIAYHIYQFNLTEINAVKKFGEKYNIYIAASNAFLNGGDMFENYLNNKLEYSELKAAGEELLLGGISKRLAEFNSMDKSNYNCPQFNYLAIDENCNVITCCVFSNVYKKIYDVKNIEEISIWRKNSKKCQDCIRIGLHYIAHNPIAYDAFLLESKYNETLAIIKNIENRVLFFWGTGNDADKCLNQSEIKNLKISAFVDSNKQKQGRKYNSYDVISPMELFEKKLSSYFVVIASTKYEKEIAEELGKNGLVRDIDYCSL